MACGQEERRKFIRELQLVSGRKYGQQKRESESKK